MSAPVASVVIPAHNEEAVLQRCLDALLDDAAPGEFDVVVAANGCTDATVRLASQYPSADVRVVETPSASKIAALNLGDSVARTYPRIYLDADVRVDTAAARELVRVLGSADGPVAAAPLMRIEMSRSSLPARAYLRVWQSLPVFAHGYVGSGCYALSAAGRGRFGTFPDVINDDQFVNDLFGSSEKTTLVDHHTVIAAPTTLRAIVRRSVRVRSGAVQASGGAAASATTKAHLLRAGRTPSQLTGVVVFVATQVAVRLLARYRRFSGNDGWLRDDTSRSSA